ncbi:MAG: ABC transporter ATP-binding protein/permease [Euryarchaeota archaeon]|nr:ABC transporter ATP-binding protein/permease [Euryarchaeota archaeon]
MASTESEETPVLGRSLWRLLPFIRPYKGRVTFGIVTNAIARFFDLLPLLVVGFIVDDIASAMAAGGMIETDRFVYYGLAIMGTFLGLAIFQSASDYAWDTLAQRVRHDIRVDIYDHLQRLDVSFFEERQTGDIMSVLSNDVDNLENFLADATTSIVRLVITFFGIYGILLWLDWRLALLLFAPLPVAVFAVRFFATRVQPQYRRSREAVGSMNSILENNIVGMGVIQAYTAEKRQAERIGEQSAEYRDAAVAAAKVRVRFVPMLYAIAGIAFGALIAVGGWVTFHAAGPSIGEFTTFVLFAMRLIMPLFILGMLLNQIQRSEASSKRIMDLLSIESRIRDAPDALELTEPPREVVFDDVRFAYTGREPVLNGVSFRVTEGKVLGIVGHTGAGKSTIIKLLLRYYEPQSGAVLIDGRPLSQIRLKDFRGHVGYVSQEPYLFTGSVADNIRLGKPEATDAEVEQAAHIAGADEFIRDLPDGYGTVVGERGMKLSGGQRQRVSLARAVLRDPAILILDEATSAVDTRTEEIIQNNLHRFRRGRMTIAVAHRLSTIRQSDEILVMVDGVVVERGTHDALVASDGVYADLWNVQSGQSEVEEAIGVV